MKLTIFGASGQCGSHIVRLAAQRGHQVQAVVRPSAAYQAPTGIVIVKGDVLDASFVASLLSGQHASDR